VRGLASLWIYQRLLRSPLRCFEEVAQRYGELCVVATPFRPGRRRAVFALGAAANRAVLTDTETFRTTGQGLSGPRGSALRRVRNGLTRTRGEKHRRIRALMLPSLQRRAWIAAGPRVSQIVEDELAPWQPGATVDLTERMRALSLRVASEVLFGIDDRRQAQVIGEFLGDFMRRSFAPDVLFTRPYGWVPGTPYWSLHRHAERMEAAVLSLIEQRKAALGDDVLSALVRARSEDVSWLTAEDLVGQVTLLFGASYETTAQALVWTVTLLAQHPEVVKELRDELAAARSTGGLGVEDLEGLSRLDGVVREALRLFPPVPYTIRIATKEADVLGVPVRRGDRVLCSHFYTHRVASSFPEPDRFVPQRWEQASPDAAEYLPFSVAPRMCIGAGFSTSVLKRTLAEMVLRADFQLPDGVRIDPVVRVTLGPRAPICMQLGPPTGNFRRVRVEGEFARWVSHG